MKDFIELQKVNLRSLIFNKILSSFYSIFIGYIKYLFALKKCFLSELKFSVDWKSSTYGFLCSIKYLVRSIKYLLEILNIFCFKERFF